MHVIFYILQILGDLINMYLAYNLQFSPFLLEL